MQKKYYNKKTWNDRWICETIYPNKSDGIFVEAGACGGIGGSCTYALEELGWTGFLFEPNTEWYEACCKNRPNSKVFNLCLGDGNEVEYIQFEQRGRSTTKPHKCHTNLMKTMSHEFIRKQSIVLSEVIKDYQIDYLALDTNGNEYEILESVDNCIINAISVESTALEIKKIRYLLNKNYDEVLNPYSDKDVTHEYYFIRKQCHDY
tara:strand:- start:244 stop:861 length:618 start_codon:yes stop_codon:yes gene_type:complete